MRAREVHGRDAHLSPPPRVGRLRSPPSSSSPSPSPPPPSPPPRRLPLRSFLRSFLLGSHFLCSRFLCSRFLCSRFLCTRFLGIRLFRRFLPCRGRRTVTARLRGSMFTEPVPPPSHYRYFLHLLIVRALVLYASRVYPPSSLERRESVNVAFDFGLMSEIGVSKLRRLGAQRQSCQSYLTQVVAEVNNLLLRLGSGIEGRRSEP